MPRSSSIRWIATSARAAPPCPGGHRRRGRFRRPRAARRRQGRERLVDRRRGHERHAHAPASQTRSGVIGSCRTRAPMTFAIAFATAPAVGTHGGSPTPFEPFGPAFGVSVSIQAIVDLRRVGRRDELVVEEVRVALTAELVELRSLGERLADAHHDAAVHLAVGADAVEDPPAVVGGRDPEHADDACVAIDLHVHGMRDQLRRVERLVAEPPDAALGGSRRRVGHARPRPCRGRCPRRRGRRSSPTSRASP